MKILFFVCFFITEHFHSIRFISIFFPYNGLVGRLFVNGAGDWGSIPVQVIPKIRKWSLMPPCLTLNIIRYRSRVKWSNPGKVVVPFPKSWCSSY